MKRRSSFSNGDYETVTKRVCGEAAVAAEKEEEEESDVRLPYELFAEIAARADWQTCVRLGCASRRLREQWRLGVRVVPPTVFHRAPGAAQLWAVFPNIDRVRACTNGPTGISHRLANRTGIRALTLFSNFGAGENEDVSGALASLTNLTALGLHAVSFFSALPFLQLTCLRRLEIKSRTCWIVDGVLRRLAGTLESFSFWHEEAITDHGLSSLTKLHTLSIGDGSSITDDGIASLASLTCLKLDRQSAGVKFDRHVLTNLVTLELGTHIANDVSLAARFPNLRRLRVVGIGEVSARCIAGLTSLTSLEVLNVGNWSAPEPVTSINDARPSRMMSPAVLKAWAVRNLSTRGLVTSINDVLPSLTCLRSLKIGGTAATYLTDSGLAPLFNLRSLDIDAPLPEGVTVAALANKPLLSHLAYRDGTVHFTTAAVWQLTRLWKFGIYDCKAAYDAARWRAYGLDADFVRNSLSRGISVLHTPLSHHRRFRMDSH